MEEFGAGKFFLLNMSQVQFCLVHNQKENRNYDHIPLNVRGMRNPFFERIYIYFSKDYFFGNQREEKKSIR